MAVVSQKDNGVVKLRSVEDGAPAASADLGDEGGVPLQWQLWPLGGIVVTAGVELAVAGQERDRGYEGKSCRPGEGKSPIGIVTGRWV